MDFLSGVVDEVKSWFAESPPEQLVLGAELWCPYGSEHTYLMLERDDIDIDNLPEANVNDCKKSVNIFPFGECAGGSLCEYRMKLEKQWENPEPQTKIVNGKEAITTKSVLLCRAGGMEIQAANSGQEFGKKLAEQINLKIKMDAEYPGLYDLLTDPYGSLYLNEGMYETALAFLADRMTDKGDIFLPAVFDGNDLENEMMRLALGKLMPRCDVSTYDRFINGLEDTGLLTGMNEKEGWDVHYLNDEMMEMLRKDCETTDERVRTDPEIRWQEENRIFTSSMSDAMTQLSKAVVMYLAMKPQSVEETGEKPVEKVKEKVKSEFDQDNAESLEKEFTDSPFDEAGKLKPNVKYQTGEYNYNYETDANGRLTNWNTDNLQLTKRTSRLRHNSNTPGKINGDQAGHLAGDRFGGSSKLDNIVSQSKNVNLSQYKKIENQWANAIKGGKNVSTNVSVKYEGNSLRPVEFKVEYTIDGKYFKQILLNQ